MSDARDRATEWLRAWVPWGLIAVAAGLGGVAGSYLVAGNTPSWVVQPFDDLVVTYSPAFLMNWAITELGDLGHQLAFATAIGLGVVTFGLVALPGVLALRNGQRALGALLSGLLLGMLSLVLTGAIYASAGAAVAATVVVAIAGLVASKQTVPVSAVRRRALGAIGTAVGVGALGLGLPRAGSGIATADGHVEIPEDADDEVREHMASAREQSLDVDGLEPLVSTSFYNVDINSVEPQVATDGWSLSVTGAVENELTLDYADIQAMEHERRFVTLRCVGDYLNGQKMDNALWGGVPVRPILEEANPQGDFVMLRAADDYYNEFPIEALWPAMLADEMNGRDLPRGHGAPVRALVPGHWGEINVKWLTEIEVLEGEEPGYWEKRNWHGTGPVKTVAKLWQTNHLEDGRVEVAGHTYAGTRGIDRVEVSTDGGDTWTEAELSEPLPGDDVWRQWVHRYEADERHEVVVRAVDGTGQLQNDVKLGPRPSGATGWVSKTVLPSGER